MSWSLPDLSSQPVLFALGEEMPLIVPRAERPGTTLLGTPLTGYPGEHGRPLRSNFSVVSP